MKKNKNLLYASISLTLFLMITFAVLSINRLPIGPNGSFVGLAFINQFIHEIFGYHEVLYTITDWMGLIPVVVAFVFGCIGLYQLLKRKQFKKVDSDILLLGGFYLVVIFLYGFFEYNIVNFRPVLIHGYLEASFPSTHVFVTTTILLTANFQIKLRVKQKNLKLGLSLISNGLILFTFIGRLLSGVHWFTDILAGGLLSLALVLFYIELTKYFQKKSHT